MHNEFTAIIERDDDWFVAYCAEVPGANGQGCTAAEARSDLVEAISWVLHDRREGALRGGPADAIRETVTVDIVQRHSIRPARSEITHGSNEVRC